ncbi:hypothetical protein K2173_017374 [Erythroxylum novogranatense]|uniref:Protein kinase domain-containing protein n=1 Tax=Erythroxylum novogranatense TaxID=1862640 RepID=A0AAV8TM45_9ROSI|nr:hypothetical protein K2173_017374 [Erythroxylum novogranatense]
MTAFYSTVLVFGFRIVRLATKLSVLYSFDMLKRCCEHKSKQLAIALGVSFNFLTLLLLAFGLVWHNEQEEGIISLGSLRNFTFRELQVATDNFNSKNILSAGAFGNVYKAKLCDGTLMAVKGLKDLEIISLAMHRNLLRLIGYYAASSERLLVYTYMSNGNVSSRLRGKPALDWNTRKRIAIGAARGLLYLHEQCDPKIIHRDVKATNVFLDEFCEAVEYLSTGQSSEKTDVFGFGILLIEFITGMRAQEFGKTIHQKGAMLEWVKKTQPEEKVEELVDRGLGNNYDRIEVRCCKCQKWSGCWKEMAQKWAASQNHLNTTFTSSLYNTNYNINVPTSDDDDFNVHDRSSSIFGDDDHSIDTYAMELSGPR